MEIKNIFLFSLSKSGKEKSVTFQYKTKCYHFVFKGFKLVRKTIRDFGLVNECLLETAQADKLVKWEKTSCNLDEAGEYSIDINLPKF
jgi:hypothetical protein